ncbi:AMP-binding protein [Ilumatobacter nonamiensis]|uniref:AMP-binding protein n=1 Tax=Ilumatobacter nonamiensis TaxID=467093 RepID=UPI000348720C|nr:AMP-binding protein [Ilumatobacter nonamiensis]
MTTSIDRGRTDTALLDQTIGANLAATVERFPDREALVVAHQGIRQTWSEFHETVQAVARGLIARGVGKGDRVAMWSTNFAEWVYVQYATAVIGAIQVNVNPAYRRSELRFALEQSGSKLLVARTEYLTSNYREMVESVRDELADLESVVFFDTDDWSDLLAAGETVEPGELGVRANSLHPDDPINIQYTSGTTGNPKGATLSHRSILNDALLVGSACGYSEVDRVCIPVPYYHCFGMVMGNLACSVFGATMVVPCPTFDPDAVLRTVEAERCTSLYGVPTMFVAELGHEQLDSFDLSSLRTGIMAGSPCPIEVMRKVIDRMNMAEVTIAYGMTETSPVSTQTTANDSIEHRVTSVGRVLPHVESKIIDPGTGEVVERGEEGEYCTRGFHVMLGYWNDEEKTAEAIDDEGWMHSGDLATMDADGYVNIVGRIKDMIIRGGENISPREIEEFLYTHPDVADAQVIGVPDEKYGEEVVAWVQLAAGAVLTEDEVKDFCRGEIAHFKVPRHVRFVDGFPMTVTGKIRKVEMRETSIAELGLESVAGSATA